MEPSIYSFSLYTALPLMLFFGFYFSGAKVLLFRDYSQTKSEINFNEFCNSLKNMVLLNDYLRKMK